LKGRTPTKKEEEHMRKARELGCMACIVKGYAQPHEVPSEYIAIHHIDGKTKPEAHFKTIGLCPEHHQHGKLAVHGHRADFNETFGTEYELLEIANKMLYGEMIA